MMKAYAVTEEVENTGGIVFAEHAIVARRDGANEYNCGNSPAVHRRAEDRAHRMGQRDSVLAYYLVTDLGTDPFVMMTLNLKASQFTGLMADKTETDDDKRDATAAAKVHMEGVLAMLRGRR